MARNTFTAAEALDLAARTGQARTVRAMLEQPRQRERRSKYANEKVELEDGSRFDSKAEHRRWLYLVQLQRAGEIRKLERQVRYELVPKQERPRGGVERPVAYVADFVYERSSDGLRVVEDVKGASTPEYRIKRKLLLWVHGIDLLEIKA